jgi:DNA repair photolyase
MEIYPYTMTTGITRSPEFEKKRLALYAANPGLKCGHGCTYCSTGALLRTHRVFKSIGQSPFDNSYAIVDPDTPDRVARDAKRIQKRGLIQLSTIVDAWAPEAQKFNLGRRCLEAILREPGWSVRILTKNAAVRQDFDLIQEYADRVLVGISITAVPAKSPILKIIEPNASTIPDRIAAMKEAHNRGLKTYAMFCPLLPCIADSSESLEELIQLAGDFGAEEICAEAVNPRGRGLILTQQALQAQGYHIEAAAIKSLRTRRNWSQYVVRLIQTIQRSVRQHCGVDKLRFLQYPSGLQEQDIAEIKKDDAGIVWLQ